MGNGRYKKRKPRDPTIREKFSPHRLVDYREEMINLLGWVTAVSGATMEIVSHFLGNVKFPGK